MGQIAQIDIRSEILIEVASMAVLHCRQEIHKLDYDAASVLDDVDEYRRLIRVMDIALDLIEAVGDLGSSEFVSISKNNEEVYTDGTTLVLKGGRDRND
jgi:hypothetical protein